MKIERNCPVCFIAYYAESDRFKHGRQTSCSRACSYVFRNREKVAARIACKCSVCGKDFQRTASQIKAKYEGIFCSSACHYAGRGLGLSGRVVLAPYQISEEGRAGWIKGAQKARKTRIERGNYAHSEASRAKLSYATANAIRTGKIKGSSRLEDKVAAFLIASGIDHVRQHVIRSANGRFACSFDFYFPERTLALEVNGTFWHSDPRAFPNGPVYEVQKRNAAKWERKILMAEALGIKIREAWESDIRENLPETIRGALR